MAQVIESGFASGYLDICNVLEVEAQQTVQMCAEAFPGRSGVELASRHFIEATTNATNDLQQIV